MSKLARSSRTRANDCGARAREWWIRLGICVVDSRSAALVASVPARLKPLRHEPSPLELRRISAYAPGVLPDARGRRRGPELPSYSAESARFARDRPVLAEAVPAEGPRYHGPVPYAELTTYARFRTTPGRPRVPRRPRDRRQPDPVVVLCHRSLPVTGPGVYAGASSEAGRLPARARLRAAGGWPPAHFAQLTTSSPSSR